MLILKNTKCKFTIHDFETSGEVGIPIGIFEKFQGHLVLLPVLLYTS